MATKMMVVLALMAINIISCEVLTNDCPAKCDTYEGAELAGEGANDDYTITSYTITFPANGQSVSVGHTIIDDDVEELREFFCLVVEDTSVRGLQWWTRVVIPWNDHCVKHESIFDGATATDADADGYNIENPETAIFGYVGPWDTSNDVTIKITPQASGAMVGAGGVAGNGEDINIFIADSPDFTNYDMNGFNFYGIYMDDSEADDHDGGTTLNAGDSWIGDNDYTGTSLVLDSEGMANDFVEVDTENTYTLSYSSGTTAITRTSPSPSRSMSGNDAGNFAIDSLFVASAKDKYAFWEICGLEPRRLPIVGASASGFLSTAIPEKAVDSVISPFSCFRSEPDSSNNHWIQIDLGREFEVKKLAIWNILYGSDLDDTIFDPDWLNSLQVYVSSCRPEHRSNSIDNECEADIGDVATSGTGQKPIFEVDCENGAIGRYVYLIPDNDNNPFQLCEVRVYGSEVNPADQTRVYFTAADSEKSVNEDDSTGQVLLEVSRRAGSRNTCTYLEYYTYRTSTDTDYDEVWPPQELRITSDTTTIPIGITDDAWCESTEDFKVVLTNIEGGILGDSSVAISDLGSSCYATVHILDDDAVTYSLESSSTTISEGSGPLELEVDRTGETAQDGSAVIKFVDGSATSDDYSNLDLNLAFSSITNSVQQNVVIHDDQCYEQSETFQINLDHLTPQCSGVDDSDVELPLTITITDNDSQFEWDFDTDDALVLEEGDSPTTINIVRDGTSQSKTVEVDINLANSAESNDFSISPSSGSVTFNTNDGSEGVTLSVTDDSEIEGDEWFYLTLRDPLDPDGDCPHNFGDDYKLKVKIVDNDGVYQWEQSSYIASESAGQIEVCVHRNGDVTNSRTLQVTTTPVGATGATGSDISTVTQIFFQAGQTRSCGFIGITPDTIDESDETFTLTFTGQGINLGAVDTTSLTIQDDDDDNTVAWEQATYDFNEGIASPTVYISHTGNSAVTVSVQSTAVSASAGADFTPISLSGFTIPAQTASYPVQLQLIDDNNDETAESFYLTLSVISPSSATVTLSQTTITILDNDPTPTAAPPASGLSGAAIAGIVIGAVVGALVLAILGGVLFWLWLRGTRAAATPKPPAVPQFPQGQQLVPLGYGNNAFGVNAGQYESQFGGYNPYASPFGF